MSIYEKNGYDSRKQYLISLSEDFGIDLDTVQIAADMLGQSEDFDGLVTTLEDYENGMDF